MAELEGFICPLCMKSLPGVLQLEEHVREDHDDSTAGRMKSNFKQFMKKTKSSLHASIKSEDSVSEGAAAVATSKGRVTDSVEAGDNYEDTLITNVSGIDISLWPPQEPGHFRNLLGMFRPIRDTKVQRIAVETNRLLVRLEKLLILLKNEHKLKPKQLKSSEQEIVPWKRDADQKRCMKCRREFNVRRRRHHCRLCGDIMCKSCSNFYPFTEAYQLMSVRPGFEPPPSGPRPQSKKNKLKKLLKDSDDEMDEEDSSEEMRVCGECEELLVRRLARMQSERKKVVTALYEKMTLLIAECDKLKPPYLEMAESLLNGEFHHNLQEAEKKRHVLIQMYEAIDKLSKQVLNLTREGGGETTPANLKLQKSNPTEEDQRRQRERSRELRLRLIKQKEEQRLLEEEKAAAASAAAVKKEEPSLRTKLDTTFKDTLGVTFNALGIGSGSKQDSKESSVGWTAAPVISDTLGDEFDPFELQRQQLLSYIEQAREAKKFDEMEALQQSLVEIESMMEQSVTL